MIERRTPNAERRTPNAERRTPNAERRTPNAERRTPNAERPYPRAIVSRARLASVVTEQPCRYLAPSTRSREPYMDPRSPPASSPQAGSGVSLGVVSRRRMYFQSASSM
ncbi:hypothetical protein FM069_06185 [Pseudomonas mangiferae]|uniref:Uncharacterized protein n=1 Tax=Pseudomonas mangiferae TaxID=2593654 RepID=A0A553H0Q6_9PSED|nr:hypothetical protein FM069_06185 [Pseudomonas mangiferae]